MKKKLNIKTLTLKSFVTDLNEKEILPADFPISKLLSSLKNPEWIDSVKPLVYDILNHLN